ncbi:MAG: glycosyltransferase family 2 protein [Marinilabiliaceae bacterium]|nr:glycosyltransferase family 2 protein [Marinilabiliaceae bacterium]
MCNIPSITTIILTFNEEIHIRRCVENALGLALEVIVVDSFSTDKTCSIAEEMGARVVQHKFVNQAEQFNWAIDNLEITTEWIWRLDADEYIEPKYFDKIRRTLSDVPDDVNGINVNKKIIFLGKPLLHGGWYPAQQIKFIRRGHGRSENRPMDEHLITTDGQEISIDVTQTDDNQNNLTWWLDKHNRYADREAIVMLKMQYDISDEELEVKSNYWGNLVEHRRWLKKRYVHLPLYLRAFLHFFVRYFVYLGFLDGNIRWYVLQCFWYRFVVDSKIYELKKRFDFDDERIKEFLSQYK